MNVQALVETTRKLMNGGRGLLAMDESPATCNKRLLAAGIPQTEAARRAYRALMVTTPALNDSISGVILHDETIRQKTTGGIPFVNILRDADILAGIKVDTGARALALHPGETITEGLDGLRGRLADYFGLGARFAKWRAVFTVTEAAPSRGCIAANAHALARYAALCQEAGIVPIVEPEVLMDGAHTRETCGKVTEDVLRCVFENLHSQSVCLEGMILKPNMVLPGSACPEQATDDEVADATLMHLRRAVPAAIAGIAFLSGGQPAERATARLNAMNARFRGPGARLPWPLSFSFARALQHPALEIWRGEDANVALAQRALLHRAACNRAALRGEYSQSMEA